MGEYRKQKRAFQRILSGFESCQYPREEIRFLTLTSSRPEVGVLIHRHFRALLMRIRRRYGKFEYLAIRTPEGNGVYHVLFKGKFIPQGWLSTQWDDIHDSPVVDIRIVTRPRAKLANYLVGHYLSGQESERLSWSWGWVFQGFCGAWKGLKKAMRGSDPGEFIRVWRLVCKEARNARRVRWKGELWLEFVGLLSNQVTFLLGKRPTAIFLI